MKSWMRRIRGAVGMGLTWAAGWAPVGVVISLIMEARAGLPIGSLIDIWVLTFIPLGFIGGAIFSTALRVLEGRSRFDELSLPRFGAWGALGGLLLGVLAVSINLVGASFGAGFGLRETIILTTSTLLSAGSATGSLALARMTDDQELLTAGVRVAEVGLSEDESRELLAR